MARAFFNETVARYSVWCIDWKNDRVSIYICICIYRRRETSLVGGDRFAGYPRKPAPRSLSLTTEKRKGIDRIALHKLEHFHPVASCRNLGRFHPPPSIGALRLSRSRWKIFTRVSFRSRGVKNCLPPAFLPRKQN